MWIFLALFVSGFCVLAQYINDGLIHKDSKDTLDFFETQLNTYERNPEIICSLAFVLQCIMDYHLPLEHHAFDKIDATLMFYVQNQYAKKIKTGAVRRLNDPESCYVMPVPVDPQPNWDSSNDVLHGGHLDGNAINQSNQPITMINGQNQYTHLVNTGDVQLLNVPGSSNGMPADPQPNSDSSNHASDGRHLHRDPESALGDRIIDWLSNEFFKPDDGTALQNYKTMKAIILLHALSLGIRRDVGMKLRQFAADKLTEFDIVRFDACQAIMHSLFLRRQNAILNPDDRVAVGKLMGLSVITLFPHRWLHQSRWEQVVNHLIDIMDPRNYPGRFLLPFAGRLDVQVFTNIRIYIAEAAAYVHPLMAKGRATTGPTKDRGKHPIGESRAWAIQTLMKVVWGKLVNTDAFLFAKAYDTTYTPTKKFVESISWKSTTIV